MRNILLFVFMGILISCWAALQFFTVPMTGGDVYLIPIGKFYLFVITIVLILFLKYRFKQRLYMVGTYIVLTYVGCLPDFTQQNLERYLNSNRDDFIAFVTVLSKYPSISTVRLSGDSLYFESRTDHLIQPDDYSRIEHLLNTTVVCEVYVDKGIYYFCTARILDNSRGIAFAPLHQYPLDSPGHFWAGFNITYWQMIEPKWYCYTTT